VAASPYRPRQAYCPEAVPWQLPASRHSAEAAAYLEACPGGSLKAAS
jgi:uncharacterized Fe-S cluster protein YjdI